MSIALAVSLLGACFTQSGIAPLEAAGSPSAGGSAAVAKAASSPSPSQRAGPVRLLTREQARRYMVDL
ncbi:MAG TPA: hypothetical protein VGY54_12410, partial [Polyangiaceae bacterium]|nr:hypothetical protein [Polyangiaceae bacterium]